MSLTRKMLKAMGIEEDKIEQIIEAHTDVTDSLKADRDKYKEDAENLLKVLKDRLLCAGLRLNDKKTRLIKFGKKARIPQDGESKPETETFDFLGFSHRCGISRSSRRFKLVRNCISKRVRKKLGEIQEKLKKVIYRPRKDMLKWINSRKKKKN